MVHTAVYLSTLTLDVRDVQSVLKSEDDDSKLEVECIAEILQLCINGGISINSKIRDLLLY